MRILVVTSWYPDEPGGRFQYVYDQTRALSDCNGDVAVALMTQVVVATPARLSSTWKRLLASTRAQDRDTFRVFAIPYVTIPRLDPQDMPRLMNGLAHHWLMSLMKNLHIDVVYAHCETTASFAREACRRTSTPYHFIIHGRNPRARYWHSTAAHRRIQPVFQDASSIILVGSPLLRDFAPLLKDISNVHVVPNGFSIPQLGTASRVPRSAKYRFVSVSNLSRSKGVHLNIEVISQLRKNGVDVEYIIVGDGPERVPLIHLIKRCGLTENVHLLGHLPHPAALTEVAHSDVFSLPSYVEACGIAHLEAMALGRPVIGCFGQGPEDFISHNVNGFLVRANDQESLYNCAAAILGDYTNAQTVAARGRLHAQSNYTWERNADALLRIFRAASARS